MTVYLITPADAENVRDLARNQIEMWENYNPEYAEGSWITEEALRYLRQNGASLAILAGAPTLPIYYGTLGSFDKAYYGDALTTQCIARDDGFKIRGVSYLEPYWNWDLCRDLGHCFRYSRKNDPEFNWRVIAHFGDAEWLLGQWGDESDFSLWLNTLDTFVRSKV